MSNDKANGADEIDVRGDKMKAKYLAVLVSSNRLMIITKQSLWVDFKSRFKLRAIKRVFGKLF